MNRSTTALTTLLNSTGTTADIILMPAEKGVK
jgi:hypothetical protein